MLYHICDMTPEAAEAHARLCYNVPDHVGLGWTPYRYLISRGATSHCAFHNERDFLAWVSRMGNPEIRWDDRGDGLRVASFEEK